MAAGAPGAGRHGELLRRALRRRRTKAAPRARAGDRGWSRRRRRPPADRRRSGAAPAAACRRRSRARACRRAAPRPRPRAEAIDQRAVAGDRHRRRVPRRRHRADDGERVEIERHHRVLAGVGDVDAPRPVGARRLDGDRVRRGAEDHARGRRQRLDRARRGVDDRQRIGVGVRHVELAGDEQLRLGRLARRDHVRRRHRASSDWRRRRRPRRRRWRSSRRRPTATRTPCATVSSTATSKAPTPGSWRAPDLGAVVRARRQAQDGQRVVGLVGDVEQRLVARERQPRRHALPGRVERESLSVERVVLRQRRGGVRRRRRTPARCCSASPAAPSRRRDRSRRSTRTAACRPWSAPCRRRAPASGVAVRRSDTTTCGDDGVQRIGGVQIDDAQRLIVLGVVGDDGVAIAGEDAQRDRIAAHRQERAGRRDRAPARQESRSSVAGWPGRQRRLGAAARPRCSWRRRCRRDGSPRRRRRRRQRQTSKRRIARTIAPSLRRRRVKKV